MSVQEHFRHSVSYVLRVVFTVSAICNGHGSSKHPTWSKHKTFVYHLYNLGPTLKMLGRRCTNVIQMKMTTVNSGLKGLIKLNKSIMLFFSRSRDTRKNCDANATYHVTYKYVPGG